MGLPLYGIAIFRIFVLEYYMELSRRGVRAGIMIALVVSFFDYFQGEEVSFYSISFFLVVFIVGYEVLLFLENIIKSKLR